MRDLIFKNVTSADRKRKVISTSETVDKAGVRTFITRHFICSVKEIKELPQEKPLPYVYVLKEKNSKQLFEMFYCRIKGSIVMTSENKLFFIRFSHSLKIVLKSICPATSIYSE